VTRPGAQDHADLSFRVLGDIEIVHGSSRIPVRAARQRTILAVLLVNGNHIVPLDYLIDAVWEDNPPATARSQIQICISALRRQLAAITPAELIATREAGYLLRLDPSQLDAWEFERLVTAGRAAAASRDLDTAGRHLEQALAFWQGLPLSGVAERWGDLFAARLKETRLGAVEDLFEIRLAQGKHREVIANLGQHLGENPLREQPRGQLMRALYQSGRQAEALELYRSGRLLLIEQLGIEPGEALRDIESAILANDLTLLSVAAPQAEAVEGGTRQLPADIADFTGRGDLLRGIARALRLHEPVNPNPPSSLETGRPVRYALPVVVLTGKAGVGKSAVALHLAHSYAGRPEVPTQLYADLRGSSAEPESPPAVLGRFLTALGVPAQSVPDSLAARAQLYRSMLAERPAMVLLDDAGSEETVRQLLPGSPMCSVIVTSRVAMGSLLGASIFTVNELRPNEATALLAKIIGSERLAAEPEVAQELVEAVDCLPLAVKILGARLLVKRHWLLADLRARLADEAGLDELTSGDTSVRLALESATDGLDPRSLELLEELSRFDDCDFPPWVAEVALPEPPADGLRPLEELVDARLLRTERSQSGVVRYRLTGLNRAFASERCYRRPVQDASSVGRVGSAWLALVCDAYLSLTGRPLPLVYCTAAELPDPHEPLASYSGDRWLEQERDNLHAIIQRTAAAGFMELSLDLALALARLFEARAHPQAPKLVREHA
jgi:DNA-binding SARP family transcriptional activator